MLLLNENMFYLLGEFLPVHFIEQTKKEERLQENSSAETHPQALQGRQKHRLELIYTPDKQ